MELFINKNYLHKGSAQKNNPGFHHQGYYYEKTLLSEF